ncbi:MAG: protein translocase subunit SecF [Bacillota bacterium]
MNMNIIGTRKIWLTVSAVFLALSLFSIWKNGMNAGIEYTGGTNMEIQLSKPIRAETVLKAIESSPELAGMRLRVQVQPRRSVNLQAKAEYGMILRTRALSESQVRKVLEELGRILSPEYGKGFHYEDVNVYRVEPSLGRELLAKAIWAVIWSSVGILLYVSFRFEFKSGVTAVVALVHDVIVVMGMASLLRLEVNGPFLAAVLTTVGYSINDTIVIYDRIRENMKARKKGETFEELVNRAILSVWRRCINTGGTTIVAIIPLFLLVPSIHEFTLSMIVGVITGTYSSIFIASALWVIWRSWTEKKQRSKQPFVKAGI